MKDNDRGLTRRSFLKRSALAGSLAISGPYIFRETRALAQTDSTTSEEWMNSTCWIGKQDCGLRVRRVNGRVVKLEGHPDHPRNLGKLCPKGMAQITALYDPYRVKAPLKRLNEKGVPGQWEQISWDEALNLVAQRMNEVIQRDKRLLIWQKGRSKAKPI